MCGIAGRVNFVAQQKIVPLEIKTMCDVIAHRGPDDEGIYIQENAGLGFRRLSIIDLSHGHQPLANEDQTIWITFNGEIYNYAELRDLLRKKGHVFRTETDTETIVHLYEEYGVSCLEYLRGMFAFSIWDERKKQLFCARDRFGIKPFYYYKDEEKIIFASELKAILQNKSVERNISQEALHSYFAYGYITGNLSIFEKIKKLPPAHYLLLSLGDKVQFEIKRYWQVAFEPDFSKTESQWCEEIEAGFSEAVRMHMISDVPLGAFLSGGIDSTSVVAMMAQHSTMPVKTFSIGFTEKKYSELQYAQDVAKKYNCEHHEFIVEPASVNLLPKLVEAYDEPFADTSAIPTYYVSKFARQHVAVALSGDGGDELFAGYKIYRYFQKISGYNFQNPLLNKILWGSVYKVLPDTFPGKGFAYYLAQNRIDLGAKLSHWPDDARRKLILSDTNKTVGNFTDNYKKELLRDGKRDFISNLQYLDLHTYLVDDILTKVDRASMLNSLEVRVPLLDHKFAELSFKIPANLKIKEESQKYILKKAMRNFLPQSVISHPKTGFDLPISTWFKNEWKEYVQDTLMSGKPLLANYLDERYVRKTVTQSLGSKRDFSDKVWALLVFEEWLKQNQSQNFKNLSV